MDWFLYDRDFRHERVNLGDMNVNLLLNRKSITDRKCYKKLQSKAFSENRLL